MFLRKLAVIVVPLVALAAVCLALPWLCDQGFLGCAAAGGLLGLALGLLLPLSGASRQREPFGGLLWVPTLLTLAILTLQYLLTVGYVIPNTAMLATDSHLIILAEAAFAVYMLTACLRIGRR